MIRQFTVLILLLAFSAPPLAVASMDGACATAKSLSTGRMPATGDHACCSTTDEPERCDTGTLALSCCSLEPAPYQKTKSGVLPAYPFAHSDQPDFTTPLRGPHVVEPVVQVSRYSIEMDTGRSPPPLRALFCTYLI